MNAQLFARIASIAIRAVVIADAFTQHCHLALILRTNVTGTAIQGCFATDVAALGIRTPPKD